MLAANFRTTSLPKTSEIVSAQYCFSEKEHAEIARRRDPEPRPEIRSSHGAQACLLSRKRGGEARRGQAARPRSAQGTDPQERRSQAQEPAREGRQVTTAA